MKSFFKSSGIFVFAALTSMFVLSSCGDKEDEAYLDVSDDLVTLSPAGGSISITVETNTADWTYSLANGDWISTEKKAQGIVLTASANALSSGARIATLTITSSKAGITRTVAINQPSSYSPYLVVTTPSPVAFAAEGEEKLVAVDTNVEDWTFNLTGGDGWLTGLKTAEGVKLTAPINDLPVGSRTATLTIASEAAGVEASVVLNQSSCFVASLVLSVESPIPLAAAGGELTIVVNSNVPDWTVGSNHLWLVVERTGSNVKISAEMNITIALRTAVLSFSSVAFPDVNKNIQVEQDRIIFELLSSWMLPAKTFTGGVANDGTANLNEDEWWVKSDDGNSILRGFRAGITSNAQKTMSYTTSNPADGDRLLLYGMAKDDFWQMEIPTTGFAAGSVLKIEGEMQSSATGPRDFLIQYSTDQTAWTPINPKTNSEITYTVRMGSAVKTPISETFTIVNAIPNGMLYIRLLISSQVSADGTGDLTVGIGGSCRVCRPNYTSEANKIPIMKVSKF